MRAKFVIRIHPDGDGIFPTDEEFANRLVKVGLGAVDAEETYELSRKRYVDLASIEWEHLPDAASDEKDRIIFFAVYPGHERLIVTRRSEGYVTIRIIHYALGELERTAEGLINQLTLKNPAAEGVLEVVDGKVEIYERGVERIIIVGSVVAKPLKTAARRNTATVVAAATTLIASITSLVLLVTLSLEPGTHPRGTLERFSTAMMATFFVGLIQFLQSWWQLRKRGDIEWDPVELTKSR